MNLFNKLPGSVRSAPGWEPAYVAEAYPLPQRPDGSTGSPDARH